MSESRTTQNFRAFAKFGSFFASFPYYFSTEKTVKIPFLLKLYCYGIFLLSLIILVQITPDYLANLQWKTTSTRPTDNFCFTSFIAIFFIVKIVSYVICLLKNRNIVKLLAYFDSYDEESHFDTKKNISPIDFHFWGLLTGSLITIVGNYLVARHQFVVILSSDNAKYYLVTLLSWGNIDIAIFLNYVAHCFCEVSFIFHMCTLVYFLRCLKQKMIALQNQIVEKNLANDKVVVFENMLLSRKVFHINKIPGYEKAVVGFENPVEKLQKLVRIMREINCFCGEFIFVFISLTLCMGIVLLYVIITSLIYMATADRNLEIMKLGMFALTTVFLFSALKVAVLVNAGEQLKNVRQNFIFNLDMIRHENIHQIYDDNTVGDLKQLIKNHKFEINACGFFIVNRKLVVAMIGSMISFIVVLVQFRSTE
ncbi:uncharacterized protein LOC118433547 [Folsomia candida]|uniref:uncharacterized protein LOC118433547 n=1 Tax=Folsomia candida TaxID=158441 RepID=UPI001604CDF8|nr:uncharacterized protein LOC118433547 [Folsomia candida]